MAGFDYAQGIILGTAAVPLMVAAISDFRRFRIPNECPLMLLALYPVYVMWTPGELAVGAGLLVATLVFAAAFGVYAAGRLGGGDVKLMAVAALWAGNAHIVDFLTIMALTGGALAVLYMTRFRVALAFAFERVGDVPSRDTVLSEQLPYGVAIAAGGLGVLYLMAA